MVLQNSRRGPFCTSEISDTLNSVAPVVIDPLQKALDTALPLLTGGGLPKGLQRFSMIYYLPGHGENSGFSTKTRTTRCRWHSVGNIADSPTLGSSQLQEQQTQFEQEIAGFMAGLALAFIAYII